MFIDSRQFTGVSQTCHFLRTKCTAWRAWYVAGRIEVDKFLEGLTASDDLAANDRAVRSLIRVDLNILAKSLYVWQSNLMQGSQNSIEKLYSL